MQYEVLLASEQKIKSFSSMNWNVDPNLLKPHILEFQDLYLQSWLGSTFYDSLRNQVLTQSINSANRTLLDNYIGQIVTNGGLYKALPFIWAQIYNKSIMTNTSESATALSAQDMKFMRQELKNTYESYAQKMVTFLTQRPGDYPDYIAPLVTSGDGVLPLRGRIFENSFVTPKRSYKPGYLYGSDWNYENDCPECYEKNGPGGYTT